MEYARFKVNQDIILKNPQGQVLLLQQDGKWKLPGGHLEAGEDWEQGLRREIEEETSITDVTIERVVRTGMSNSKNTYLITFIGTTQIPEVVFTTDEHSAFIWADKQQVIEHEFWYQELQELVVSFM